MATIPTVQRRHPLRLRFIALEAIPLAWRIRGGLLLVTVLAGSLAIAVLSNRTSPAPLRTPAPVENTALPALSAGELATLLTRSVVAPNAVNLELTYAPPTFFEAIGKEPLGDGVLAFFLQEDTHIDALEPTPAQFYLVVDGQGHYVPSQGTIVSDSGHHRLSNFVFDAGTTPSPRRELRAVFVFADATTGSATWTLPLDRNDAAVIGPPVALPSASLAPVALTNLNAVLRKVKSDVVYGSVRDAELAVTYATPEYFQAALSPEASRRYSPTSNAVFLVSETTHTTDLSADLPAFALRFQGQTYAPDLVEPTVSSLHHRVTMLRFPVDPSRIRLVSALELQLPDGSSLSWGLPIVYADGDRHGNIDFNAASVLSLVGGMLAAMWPCLFQLTVFFIPALAGVSMEEAHSSAGWRSRLRVLRAALFFIAGFTIVYTAAGALVGFAVQKFGSAPELDAWQRYFGVGAGLAIIVLALRTAAKVRAPLVCKMPVLSRMAHSRKASGPLELMLAGLAFATGCMTCFGAALIIAMVVYVGMAGSALVGGLTLFLFSMGMGIPLLIAAAAMGKVLPVLTRLERITPWMGLASSVVMIGYAILLMAGNYMAFTNWLIERL